MHAKGGQPKVESESQIWEIRRRFDAKERRKIIAFDHKMSVMNIYKIGRRETYKHIPEEEPDV